ncbi:MAG: acyl carrier protein [Myxococcales bacterium]|nr:acyl carrier protein [Myxococcales bacterium]
MSQTPDAARIISELDRIFVDQFELDATAVVPAARLREDLDLDSLDAADMLVAIEKKFGIRLDDQVARQFRTVDDIHSYVRKLVDEKAGAASSAAAGP